MPDTLIERRLRAALHAPVATDTHARDRIMARVREAAANASPAHLRSTQRPRSRYSIAGLALAAGIGSITVAGSIGKVASVSHTASLATIAGASVHDTLAGALLDTMQLVRQLTLGGQPEIERRYAVVVDMTRFVPDPAAARIRADDGRFYTLLHPTRVSD